MAYRTTISLETLEDNDSFISPITSRHECVALVQQVSSAPNTMTWRRGLKVMDSRPGSISSGTIIATFDEGGRYPRNQKHAAIYVSHNDRGIVVYDQWASSGKVKSRVIRKRGSLLRNVNDADWYWVVE